MEVGNQEHHQFIGHQQQLHEFSFEAPHTKKGVSKQARKQKETEKKTKNKVSQIEEVKFPLDESQIPNSRSEMKSVPNTRTKQSVES